METIKLLGISLTVILLSSVTFAGVSVPLAVVPEQAMVAAVLEALDGPLAQTWASSPVSGREGAALGAPEPAAALQTGATEVTRLQQYVALHRAQAWQH